MQTQQLDLNGNTGQPDIQLSFPEPAAPAHARGRKGAAQPGGCALEDFTQSGAESPRGVIRGESFENSSDTGEDFRIGPIGFSGRSKVIFIPKAKKDGEPWAALTDYLNATFLFVPSQENMVQLVQHFRLLLGESFGSLEQRKGGLHGYQTSFTIGKTGGLLAYGGQCGTAFVSLPGSACTLIQDWHGVYHLFHDILKARITRWDGAVDVFDGVPSVNDAVRFYLAGDFNAGGNQPSCSQQGNWLSADGSGRTFYVGKRKNGKLLRVYEKGKQLGDETSPWVRWELELHNRDRIIPWEVILEPGKYLAASYSCMNWVSEIQERIKTTQRTVSISYQHLAHYARKAYGPLINVMLEVEGSPEKVIELLQRPGIPARLQLGEHSPAEFINEPLSPASDAQEQP